jgi:hypothetical protein
MHLFVVTHGLQGNPESLYYLCKYIEENVSDSIVLNSKYNSQNSWFSTGPFKNWYLTSDGIDNGGKRLTQEIIDFVVKNQKTIEFKKISFVGSSLGGLYCRFAMGLLFDSDEDVIKINLNKTDSIPLKLENFVSLASPLIGVQGLQNGISTLGTKVYFFMGTGSQLSLDDSEEHPLIFQMNSIDSMEYQALKSCKKRITICSTHSDEWKVPYQSSAIVPWKTLKMEINSEKMVNAIHFDEENEIPIEDDEKFYENNPKSKLIEKMIQNLRRMNWIRVDVNLYHPQAAILTEGRKEVIECLVEILNSEE